MKIKFKTTRVGFLLSVFCGVPFCFGVQEANVAKDENGKQTFVITDAHMKFSKGFNIGINGMDAHNSANGGQGYRHIIFEDMSQKASVLNGKLSILDNFADSLFIINKNGITGQSQFSVTGVVNLHLSGDKAGMINLSGLSGNTLNTATKRCLNIYVQDFKGLIPNKTALPTAQKATDNDAVVIMYFFDNNVRWPKGFAKKTKDNAFKQAGSRKDGRVRVPIETSFQGEKTDIAQVKARLEQERIEQERIEQERIELEKEWEACKEEVQRLIHEENQIVKGKIGKKERADREKQKQAQLKDNPAGEKRQRRRKKQQPVPVPLAANVVADVAGDQRNDRAPAHDQDNVGGLGNREVPRYGFGAPRAAVPQDHSNDVPQEVALPNMEQTVAEPEVPMDGRGVEEEPLGNPQADIGAEVPMPNENLAFGYQKQTYSVPTSIVDETPYSAFYEDNSELGYAAQNRIQQEQPLSSEAFVLSETRELGQPDRVTSIQTTSTVAETPGYHSDYGEASFVSEYTSDSERQQTPTPPSENANVSETVAIPHPIASEGGMTSASENFPIQESDGFFNIAELNDSFFLPEIQQEMVSPNLGEILGEPNTLSSQEREPVVETHSPFASEVAGLSNLNVATEEMDLSASSPTTTTVETRPESTSEPQQGSTTLTLNGSLEEISSSSEVLNEANPESEDERKPQQEE